MESDNKFFEEAEEMSHELAAMSEMAASPDGSIYPLPAPSLKEIIRKDKDLYDFFKLVEAKDFRMKALELLEAKLKVN